VSIFDTPIERRGTDSFKWDDNGRVFGRSDLMPFWVAGMDFATPQPILCIRGAQIPAFVCSGVASRPGPNRGPWSLTKGSGEANPGVFTVQAVVEDQGSTSRVGFSVSNAIILQIQ